VAYLDSISRPAETAGVGVGTLAFGYPSCEPSGVPVTAPRSPASLLYPREPRLGSPWTPKSPFFEFWQSCVRSNSQIRRHPCVPRRQQNPFESSVPLPKTFGTLTTCLTLEVTKVLLHAGRMRSGACRARFLQWSTDLEW
jgi:hypothetical protein